MFRIFTSIFAKLAKAASKPTTTTAPHWSLMMKNIFAALVENHAAVVLTGEKVEGRNGESHYTFYHERCIYSRRPFSRALFFNSGGYLNARKTVAQVFGNDLTATVAFCEGYAAQRSETEWEDNEARTISLAIAHAVSLNHSGKPLRLKGNFSYVGDLEGSLIIDGNVDRIWGSVGPSLVINGNVGQLWGETYFESSDLKIGNGEEAKLVINGDFLGYKTSIRNSNLTIEIAGDVLTKHSFLYEPCIFKRMVIHGDLLTREVVCPGFFVGDLKIEGRAHYLLLYLDKDAPNLHIQGHRGGNIFLGDMQVLRDGLSQVLYLLHEGNRPYLNKRVVPTREGTYMVRQ
jgi:hypothetical protein